MTADEVGGYIRLLCYQWDTGSVPDDDSTLARLGGCKTESIAAIRTKFVRVNGVLTNQRLEIERQKQADYREKQRLKGIASGESRRTTVQPRFNRSRTAGGTKREPEGNSPSPSPSPDSDPVTDLQSPSVKGKGKQRISKLPDSEWISALKANPAYHGIDIDRELGKMQAWATESRKSMSRRRFINWLNRADVPIAGNGSVTHSLSLFDMKTILQAKEREAEALKNRHASVGPLDTNWNDVAAKSKFFSLRKDIKELNSKIANYASH